MANTVTDIQRRDYGVRQQPQVIFTPEEIKVWQECMRSSSLLIPTLLSAAAGYGICKVTQFRGQARYVAMFTGLLGLVSNRISISAKCLSKVEAMPNSNLRERMRDSYKRSKSLHYQGFQPLDVQSQIQASEEPSTEIVFDDYPPMNTYDTYSSFNDSTNDIHSVETDLTEPINLQKSVSYDELRHKNREEHYNKTRQWYAAKEQSTRASEATPRVYRSAEPSSNAPSVQQKNQYGDVWG